MAGRYALHRLDSFLNANDPKMVRLLVSIWKDQGDAITYKELREAIGNGYMSEETFQAWQQDYIRFFNSSLSGILEAACTAGSREIAAAMLEGRTLYAPMADTIQGWVKLHGAELVTNMTAGGKEALSTMIRYTSAGNLTVDELARVIRPTIGLTTPQATANLHYYENIKARLLEANEGMKQETAARRAQDAAARYAARQQRQRAQTIAQTELAYAYNKGADEAVKQLVRDGLLPKMKAVWSTADDELVCSVCGAMDGTAVNLDDYFILPNGGSTDTPPAHPNCRCAVAYEEDENADGAATEVVAEVSQLTQGGNNGILGVQTGDG